MIVYTRFICKIIGKSPKILTGGLVHSDLFYSIISPENLLSAWKEFKRGKIKKREVQEFDFYLERNIFLISSELKEKTYIPDPYIPFYVCDPKRRHIHKASVRDRIVHQAVYRVIGPIFEREFIHDSYSCRKYKGTHCGVKRLVSFTRKETQNHKDIAYTLKCDVRKFFDSIDHTILQEIVTMKINDENVSWLIDVILKSFEKTKGKGLPLGNVTSQMFGNVYMHRFDHFIKHMIKARFYLRYCDDFVIVHRDRKFLEGSLEKIETFLREKLQLELHPNKIEIRKVSQGIDFLGYVVLPHAIVLRTKTGKRIMRKVNEKNIQSYLGVLSHCHAQNLCKHIIAKARPSRESQTFAKRAFLG